MDHQVNATVSPGVKESTKPKVVFVLQGGGALGAHQADAYQALSEYQGIDSKERHHVHIAFCAGSPGHPE